MRARSFEALALAAAALAVAPAHAAVEGRLFVHGLQDVELFETDDDSRLLSRNEGDAAGGARLRLWVAAEVGPGFQAVAEGLFEHANTEGEAETEADLSQAFLRYTRSGRAPLRFEAGKLALPFGDFSRRYLSSVNPLIGAPDSYDVAYPTVAGVSGRAGWLDYRALAFDQPLANENYVPPADRAWRPGVGLGVTPRIGLRFGGYWTRGPYLDDRFESYDQEVAGVELEWSRSHFEVHADVAFSSYEVPTIAQPSRGVAWYVEPKYTFTPRFYAALRLERNDYPFIRENEDASWLAVNAAFYDVELGAGWRVTPGLQIKASYRFDRWQVDPSRADFFPDGYAVAAQLSYTFDLASVPLP